MRLTKATKEKEVIELSQSFECKNCGECCRYGSGVMSNNDIPKLAKFLDISEEKLKKEFLEQTTKFNTILYRPRTKARPFGECIFYDKIKKCTIHPAKPLNCRIANCGKDGESLNLWFQLNHFINPNDEQSIREYAFYLKTKGKTLPKARLADMIKSKKRLKEILDVGGLNQDGTNPKETGHA